MRNLTLLICVSLFFTQCYSGLFKGISSDDLVVSNQPSNIESGKCYAKCLIRAEEGEYVEPYFVYIGDSTKENVSVKRTEILVKPGESGKWIQKVDEDCQATNPEDCKIWCMVDLPAEYVVLNILEDTSTTKNYEVVNITKTRIEATQFNEWREVLCPKDLTATLIQKINTALSERGFYNGEISKQFNNKSKRALMNFQKANGLPIGQLDTKTLDLLGINY